MERNSDHENAVDRPEDLTIADFAQSLAWNLHDVEAELGGSFTAWMSLQEAEEIAEEMYEEHNRGFVGSYGSKEEAMRNLTDLRKWQEEVEQLRAQSIAAGSDPDLVPELDYDAIWSHVTTNYTVVLHSDAKVYVFAAAPGYLRRERRDLV